MAKTAKAKKAEKATKAKALKQLELPLDGIGEVWLHPPNDCSLKGSIFGVSIRLSVSPVCPRCRRFYQLKQTGDSNGRG